MATAVSAASHLRGLFHCRVPVGALSGALLASGVAVEGEDILLETERGATSAPRSLNGKSLRPVAYPRGAIVLTTLLRQAAPLGNTDGEANLYLPKATFSRIADAEGATPLEDFELTPGAGDSDDVIADLEDCLHRAMKLPATIHGPVVDRLVDAIHVHVARLYGGMRHQTAPAVGGLAPWQLRKSQMLIEEHLAEPISVAQLAEACGLSPGHFSRQFAFCMKATPHQWIMRRRIEIARKKLSATGMSLADVALSTGFADQSHFTRAFTSVTGISPGRWRREKRAQSATVTCASDAHDASHVDTGF